MANSGGSTQPSPGGLSPEEAFGLVGNDIRAEILRVLSQARGGEGRLTTLSFSELHSRIEADIDSSQFNYHLQQLTDTFVERRGEDTAQLDDRMAGEAEAGYVLRPEGTILTRTIRANVATSHSEVISFTLDLDCYFCGTTVVATYGNALFMIHCPECDYMYEYDLTPPGGFDDDEQETLTQVGEYLRQRRLAFARGSCPLCANGLETAFIAPEEMVYPRADLREVIVNRWCEHCGERNYLRIGEVLLREPTLIAFCNERGTDVTTTQLWQLEFAVTDRYVTVRTVDPWEVAFDLRVNGEILGLAVNENLDLID